MLNTFGAIVRLEIPNFQFKLRLTSYGNSYTDCFWADWHAMTGSHLPMGLLHLRGLAGVIAANIESTEQKNSSTICSFHTEVR